MSRSSSRSLRRRYAGQGLLLLAIAFVLGCTRSSPGAAVGRTSVLPLAPEPAPDEDRQKPPALPPDIVERSALPYHGVRLSDGQALEPDELYRELERAHVICAGEAHDNPHHHFAQLEIARHLTDSGPSNGRQLGLGFEMFQRQFQDALSEYAARDLSERRLLEATQWEERWGMDVALYRPLWELGRERKLTLLALNAPSEITRKIAKQGLASLSQPERALLPELDLEDADHREAFDAAMSHHPGASTRKLDNYYAAQVAWDESMATAVVDWLKGAFPARQVIVFAGSAHCASWAIPSRIRRRLSARVLSVMPVQGELPTAKSGYDYAFVMTDE